ncbi:unnamed protein product [Linum tenue]|uniref:S-protein homolog n=1 Tax=Linum tenue TaxID=586396 RepID=A0AAV0RSH5_9ROSI|nr:unnamed protein product [Linum tenue]
MRRAILIVNVISMVIFTVVNDVAKAERTNGFFPIKKTVTITNALQSRAQVKLHCKSKDDDLGIRMLRYDDSFHFGFRPNIFFTTLFYCSFEWPGSGRVHWYDVYDDMAMNCINCKYLVKPFGLCKYNLQTHDYDKCEPWNNEEIV